MIAETSTVTINVAPFILFVLYLLLLLGLMTVLTRVLQNRAYDRLEHARWEPVPPGPTHERLQPLVAQLVAEGYAIDSFAEVPSAPRRLPIVALVHPDGTMATVVNRRTLGGISLVMVSLDSVLVPGVRSLTTVSTGGVAARADSLVVVVRRREGVTRMRSRHRSERAWLELQGVRTHPVVLGQAGAVMELGMQAAARQRAMTSYPVVLWRQLSGGGRFRRHLSERPEVRPVIEAVRAEQAAAL